MRGPFLSGVGLMPGRGGAVTGTPAAAAVTVRRPHHGAKRPRKNTGVDEARRKDAVELYRGNRYTVAEIAELVGCSVSAVYRVLGELLSTEERRRRPRRRPIDEAQRERVVELYRGGTYSERGIAEVVGCSNTTVHGVLRDLLSLEERRSIIERAAWVRRRYRYRRDLFVEPVSDDELWLFGLLMADGTTDGRHVVRLELSVGDRDAVESARRVAGSNAPITVRKKSRVNATGIRGGALASWAIHSREIVSRVTALGMMRAKSHREGVHVPETIAQSPSFWRGVIDGDGAVGWHRPGGGRPYARLQVLGGRALLEQWAAFVVANIGEPWPTVGPAPSGKLLHVSVLSASRAWRTLRIIYGQGGPALERKRKAALEILASPQPVPRPKPVAVEVAALALAKLRNVPLNEVPRAYVCPRTGVRLGQLLSGARRGYRPDLHELFERHDPEWRVSSLGRKPISVRLVQLALTELRDLPLHRVAASYVCPRTGVRLGVLLRNARRGGRPDLHELFDRQDPEWRVPQPHAIPVDLVELALAELAGSPLHEVTNRYVCPRTGVGLGRLLRNARHGQRRDLHDLFDRHDPEWRRDG
jgi:transposase